MTNFLNIFANSPFSPIQQHMQQVFECAESLLEFVTAVFADDWDKATLLQQKISTLEGDADKLKQQIRLQMPSGLLMPVSRGDILELLTEQDNIANAVKDIAGIILGRKMHMPSEMHDMYTGFVNACVSATEKSLKAVQELDDLLETGFKGQEARLVKRIIVELDQLERETDEIQVQVRGELFALEKTLDPIDAIFMYQIIYKTGTIADYAQKVGHRLQLLIAN